MAAFAGTCRVHPLPCVTGRRAPPTVGRSYVMATASGATSSTEPAPPKGVEWRHFFERTRLGEFPRDPECDTIVAALKVVDVALLDQGIPSLKSRFVGRAHLNSRHDWENMPARPRRRSGIVRTIIARAYCAGRRHRVSCTQLNSRPLELRTYLKKVMRLECLRPTATASECSGFAPTGSSRAVSCIHSPAKSLHRPEVARIGLAQPRRRTPERHLGVESKSLKFAIRRRLSIPRVAAAGWLRNIP